MSGHIDDCSDPEMLKLVVMAAADLARQCKTAIVMLTSKCSVDDHGNHCTVAVMSQSGRMSRTEAQAAVRRLRSLAEELETRFCPADGAN